MDELQILVAAALEVAQLRYRAYILYEENQRLSFEIEFRIKEISDLINARMVELTQVRHQRRCGIRVLIENKLSNLRKRPKISYIGLSILRANAISLADIHNVVPFYRH